jgi:hypothetical protein
MKILAIGAEAQEINPWLRVCPQKTELHWPIANGFQVRWNGAALYAVSNGPGPHLAKQALETAVSQAGPFDSILSVGLCGALNPQLTLQTICTASSVSDGVSTWPAKPFPGANPQALLSIDKFLGEPAEKQSWAAKGFGIVEMEAAPIAQFAAENGIPFYAIKIVSDQAHESFSLDFNHYRDAAGRFDKAGIARAALLHPFRYVPELYRLASRGFAASETLRVFLAHARY